MEKEKSNFLEHVRAHRHKLERRMQDHMESDESASRNTSLKEMIACWFDMNSLEHKLEHCRLNQEDVRKWVNGMKNADGTTGPHWTMEQTTAAAKVSGVLMSHISQEDFWAVMNMMYSDYSAVADKFNVNKPEFFAELAKGFLFDKDGPRPEEKLSGYYWGIVCSED